MAVLRGNYTNKQYTRKHELKQKSKKCLGNLHEDKKERNEKQKVKTVNND